MLTMESVEPTISEITIKDGNQSADTVLSSKPLHRFVRTQPRVIAVAIVIFGCAELLMGFPLTGQTMTSRIYIPFWQGILFVVCGSLSIYTEIHPSKKMVTVCLAMYLVALVGIVVSTSVRIVVLIRNSYYRRWRWSEEDHWDIYAIEQIMAVESVLVTSSLCVLVLLITLGILARLALKSSRSQVIIRHIPAPQRDASSN